MIIIGPLPEPMNGCSYANEILCRNLQKRGIGYKTINTSTTVVSSKQGTSFSLKKATTFIKTYFSAYKVFQAKVVYLTPGQTFFGLTKYAPFILLCVVLRKPYIIHLHGNYMGEEYAKMKGLKAKFFRFLVANAHAGIALSGSLRKNFYGLLPDSKVHVVENFVDRSLIDSFHLEKKPFDQLRIIYLSNLMEEKGILDLLNALTILQQENIPFEVKLAGKIEDSINEQLQEKIKVLSHHVEYMGIIKDNKKNNALYDSNIFVLPTYYKMEGQPISILEGMASGNIILTTSHAGIPDIMDERNGYFIEKENPESIAKALKSINQNLEDEITKFATYNAEYVKSKFTEQLFSEKIIKIASTITK